MDRRDHRKDFSDLPYNPTMPRIPINDIENMSKDATGKSHLGQEALMACRTDGKFARTGYIFPKKSKQTIPFLNGHIHEPETQHLRNPSWSSHPRQVDWRGRDRPPIRKQNREC